MSRMQWVMGKEREENRWSQRGDSMCTNSRSDKPWKVSVRILVFTLTEINLSSFEHRSDIILIML